MLRITTRLLALAALATLALAGSAQARQIQQYFYAGEYFSAGGSSPAALAVDSVNHKVLVVGNGDNEQGLKVSKFELNGDPAGFSGRSEAISFNIPGTEGTTSPPKVSIAVDESGTATDGDFYVTWNVGTEVGQSRVYGFAPSGTPLPGFPITGQAFCGVTVAPDGHPWVASGTKRGAYVELTESGTTIGKLLSVGASAAHGGGHGVCRIAIDSAGNIYVSQGGRLGKYDSNLHFVGDMGFEQPEAFSQRGSPLLAFDRGADTLFELFDSGSPASQPLASLDSSGNPLATFGGPDPAHFSYGGLTGAKDFGVDQQTHKVYALDQTGEVNVFSPAPP